MRQSDEGGGGGALLNFQRNIPIFWFLTTISDAKWFLGKIHVPFPFSYLSLYCYRCHPFSFFHFSFQVPFYLSLSLSLSLSRNLWFLNCGELLTHR